VTDLQTGREIIEEKARAELGMVRPNELLVQYTPAR
jgi:cell division protein FtsB